MIRLYTCADVGSGSLTAVRQSFRKKGVDGDTHAAVAEAVFVGVLSDVRKKIRTVLNAS